MDFSNLVILITGASKGIGLMLAKILSSYHATVIGTYNETKIEAPFISYKCDLRKEKDIQKLFKYLKKEYGTINVLVNCAACQVDNDLDNKTKKEFMDVLEVNLVAPFLMCKYASKIMDKGVIVNISSTDGIDTFNPYEMDYASSKAGLNNLTKTLAMRLPSLKVCALAPNFVDTKSTREMDPLFLQNEMERIHQKKLLKEEEVALKIIEIIINDDYVSGSVIRMDDSNE